MTQKKGGKKGKGKAKAAKRDPAEPHLHKDGALYIIRPIPERNIQQLTALQQQFIAANAAADAAGPCDPHFPGDSMVMLSTVDGDSGLASVWTWLGQPIYPAGPHRALNDIANTIRGSRNMITCLPFHPENGVSPTVMVKVSAEDVTDLDIIERDLTADPGLMTEWSTAVAVYKSCGHTDAAVLAMQTVAALVHKLPRISTN
eukprot:7118-Heterococcus_DN1.PRE.2